MVTHIDELTRSKPLYGMFTAVPRRYDLINRVITWGQDKKWRRQAARECLAAKPAKILDLCCGTGDLAINIAGLAENSLELTGVDYSRPMLEIAARKTEHLGQAKKITFIHGEAANLPLADGYFDCIGISFAFRNLTYQNPLASRHIAEILRLLKAGGRCVIIETSQPRPRLIRWLFHRYLRWLVYRVGHWVSGNRGAYYYLAESAARFYTPQELKEILLAAGFSQVSCRPLFFGVVGIYVAVK